MASAVQRSPTLMETAGRPSARRGRGRAKRKLPPVIRSPILISARPGRLPLDVVHGIRRGKPRKRRLAKTIEPADRDPKAYIAGGEDVGTLEL